MTTESIFAKSSAERKKDQDKKLAANDLIESKSSTKVRVNFSLSPDANEKMRKKAEELDTSKSALLERLINQDFYLPRSSTEQIKMLSEKLGVDKNTIILWAINQMFEANKLDREELYSRLTK